MAYVASSDYIEFADIGTYDSDDEVRWTNHITRAKALIDNYCKRTFEANNDGVVGDSDNPVTRYFDAYADVDGYELFVDRDLCLISSITNGDSDGTTVTSDQYVTEPRNDAPYYAIRILSSANTDWEYSSDPENAIAIAGVWAYSLTAPADVQYATLLTVDYMEKRRTSNPDIDRSILAGDGNVVLPVRLPADAKMVLDMYRRIIL